MEVRFCVAGFLAVLTSAGAFAQSHTAPTEENSEPATTNAVLKPAIAPVVPKRIQVPEPKINWSGLISQSLFFTGLQHGFRFATEPGTRAGMRGHFLEGYAYSVGNLHGWDDGDPFYVNYVGHPLQGAVSGYLYAQNDAQAKLLRFGSDRRYWRSRMKAMGYAFAYSAWFEIGPISESSMGKVQGKRPQQGLVDHVVTPVIGTGWMIAEDFLDEKVILPFERKFENRWARMMVRGWLNPSRSFANMMRLKVPWYRDNRGGIRQNSYREIYELEPEAPREMPLAAVFELSAQPIWTNFGDTQCAGAGGQGAFRLSPGWQIIAQVNGCQLRDQPAHWSGDSLTYAMGPRWTPQSQKRFSPYAQILVGGNKFTRYEVDPIREALLKDEAKRDGKPAPEQELYTRQHTNHGLALLAGTGIDVRVNPALALRLASVEYGRSWAMAGERRNYNHGIQLSTGVVLRVGTW